MYEKQIGAIEGIIRKNLDNRGLDGIFFKGDLMRSCEGLLCSTTVMIVTGFVIKDAMVGETDGPLGAVSLAGALEQLGKKVVLVTDTYSEKMLEGCCKLKGIGGSIEIVPYDNADEFCTRLLEKYQPSHVVAIERPGRAKDGRCYSMRGEDIGDIVPDTDTLFVKSKEKGITTIAVGDGGNELGMGKAALNVVNQVKNGEKICAAASCDYLIIAGVSNWGGHAIAAGLSLIAGKMLLHDSFIEKELLQCMVNAGAVDGCTKRKELTVDGLSLDENISILLQLSCIVSFSLTSDLLSYTLIVKA